MILRCMVEVEVEGVVGEEGDVSGEIETR